MNEAKVKARMGRAIKIMRETAGMTQQQLADGMNTTQSSVARLEAGGRWPSSTMVARILDATGISGVSLAMGIAEREID
jgi:transcriptional regulator with XRE-family HTH domain